MSDCIEGFGEIQSKRLDERMLNMVKRLWRRVMGAASVEPLQQNENTWWRLLGMYLDNMSFQKPLQNWPIGEWFVVRRLCRVCHFGNQSDAHLLALLWNNLQVCQWSCKIVGVPSLINYKRSPLSTEAVSLRRSKDRKHFYVRNITAWKEGSLLDRRHVFILTGG